MLATHCVAWKVSFISQLVGKRLNVDGYCAIVSLLQLFLLQNHTLPSSTHPQTTKKKTIFFPLPPHPYPTSVEPLKQAAYTRNTKEDSLISVVLLLSSRCSSRAAHRFSLCSLNVSYSHQFPGHCIAC